MRELKEGEELLRTLRGKQTRRCRKETKMCRYMPLSSVSILFSALISRHSRVQPRRTCTVVASHRSAFLSSSPERPYQGVGKLIDQWQRKSEEAGAKGSPGGGGMAKRAGLINRV